MIFERGGSKKENDIAKWEGKIGKSPTLSKLFTKVTKSQWRGSDTHVPSLSTPLTPVNVLNDIIYLFFLRYT